MSNIKFWFNYEAKQSDLVNRWFYG